MAGSIASMQDEQARPVNLTTASPHDKSNLQFDGTLVYATGSHHAAELYTSDEDLP